MLSEKLKAFISYFTKGELVLWFTSVIVIVISFLVFDKENFLTLIASLIGVTSLIFNAKGNPLGQFLIVVFSIFYAVISFKFAYYGEMITYLGMTAPMAIFSLISWLKNPYNENKSEVKVNRLQLKDVIIMLLLTVVVTLVFYHILDIFNTENIIFSTMSVTTSFVAVFLTFRRSTFYAIGYAANDIILIIMWISAVSFDISYISVVVCFVIFLVNDIYGFISWTKMQKRQNS
ncbi:MAG: nicotinamide riboside transporter PnuC [Ruminococcus sp.]|nr:nicotinamide riboside transporter PnuC [Ruminococcus sp.]